MDNFNFDELENNMQSNMQKYRKNMELVSAEDRETKYKKAFDALRTKCIQLFRLYVYHTTINHLLIYYNQEAVDFLSRQVRNIFLASDLEKEIQLAINSELYMNKLNEIITSQLNNTITDLWLNYIKISLLSQNTANINMHYLPKDIRDNFLLKLAFRPVTFIESSV